MKKISLLFLFAVFLFSLSLKAEDNKPILKVDSVGKIQYDRATFYGNFISQGNWSNLNGLGFILSEEPVPRGSNGKTFSVSTAPKLGLFNQAINENKTPNYFLKSGTRYYLVCYVKKGNNDIYNDTTFSDVFTFETPPATPPSIEIKESSPVGTVYATFNGVIEKQNDPLVYNKGFVYSQTPNPTHETGKSIPLSTSISKYPYTMTYKVEGLKHNTTYYVRSWCIYKFNNKEKTDTLYSDDENIFTTKHICGVEPMDIRTLELTETSAKLTWVKGESQSLWDVEYGYIGHQIGEGKTVTLGTDTITITNLTPGKSYSMFVRAKCDDQTTSEWSEMATFTTVALKCAPPVNIYARDVKHSSAVLLWTPGANTQTQWEVLFSKENESYPSVGFPVVNTSLFTVVGLTATSEYKVKIRAVCVEDNMFSDWSEEYRFMTVNPEPIALDDVESNSNLITIYPNPTDGTIYFKSENENVSKIEIWNNLGELIFESNKFISSYTISNSQPKGLFLIKVYSNKGLQTKKIIFK